MAAITTLTDVTNQIQKFWSPLFMKELRATMLLGSLVNRDYEGEIKQGGDTVYVSQINAPSGQILTVGTDADSYAPEALSTSRISIQATKRAVASFEFQDLAVIQSQLESEESEIRQALLFAVDSQINTYLYSLVAPSTSAPDHELASVTDLNSAQLSAIRVLAGEAKWDRLKKWYGLCSPAHYMDIADDTQMSGSDYVGEDRPILSGQLGMPRYGFNIFEDTSRTGDYSIFFHPDFMHLVTQREVQFKISDLHANKRFGFVISADIIFGATLGISGSTKHIRAQ